MAEVMACVQKTSSENFANWTELSLTFDPFSFRNALWEMYCALSGDSIDETMLCTFCI